MSSSFHAAVEKLRTPVKELVFAATENGQRYVGQSEAEQIEVINWIEKSEDFVTEGRYRELDNVLLPRTYLATNYFTAADVALFGHLWPIFSKLQPMQYYSTPSLTRYFDHIQHQQPVRTASLALSPNFFPVRFDFENAPAIERRTEVRRKVKKEVPQPVPVVEPEQEESSSSTPETQEEPQAQAQKKEKKEKKEKKNSGEEGGKKNKAKAVPAAEEVGEPMPSMIDLRVGHIVDIMKHPDADGLYIEQIDVGEETPRTVVSGLVNYIPIEDMRDQYLVAVCNLKPANMRGVKSYAMVLCATSKNGKEGGIELIQPPPGSKPGERVYFEGGGFEKATPISQLNPKKKIFETIQPGFTTLDSREAAWVNPITKSIHRIRTKEGVCVAPSLVAASLS